MLRGFLFDCPLNIQNVLLERWNRENVKNHLQIHEIIKFQNSQVTTNFLSIPFAYNVGLHAILVLKHQLLFFLFCWCKASIVEGIQVGNKPKYL